MKEKPVILITAAREPDAATGLDLVRLHKNYVDSVVQAGGLPIIPPYAGSEADRLAEMADGLLLSGGRDIEPERMSCARKDCCGPTDCWRDDLEWALLDCFVKRKKPVLGICRGLQVINGYFGGTLFQDIPSELDVVHRDVVHAIQVRSGSVADQLFGDGFLVNSYHHQAVDRLGCGLELFAWSDGVAEGLQHTELPIWAVQWHPERMTDPDRFNPEGPDMAPLFSWWVNQAAAE